MIFKKTNEINELSDISFAGGLPSVLRRKAKYAYIDQLICLSALVFMATWRSGFRALVLVSVSVLVSMFVDMVCCGLSKKTYNPRDISTVTAGISIALMMPASISYAIIIWGSAMAIGIKHIFGGKDNYIFNPTAVTLAFLIICYPASMLLYPKTGEILPIFGEITATLSSGLESFLIKLGTAQEMSILDVILGNFQGSMGTTHVFIILVCAVCLLFRRSVSVTVTLSALFTIIFFAALFPLYSGFLNTLVYELIGGYLLFGLLFLANDPQTLPKTEFGKFYYGVLLGILVMGFRYFGKVEGSFVFALLIANTLSLRLDDAAEKSLAIISSVYDILRRRVSTYERIRETVKTGEPNGASLFDTQEIIIDPTNYNMPPIDNKVIKINRKKRGIVARMREKLAPVTEKGTEKFFMSTQKKQRSEDEMPQIHMRRHVKRQVNTFFARVLDLIGQIKKHFTKIEIVEPIRHKSQAVETKPAISIETADNNDIEIMDFEEIIIENETEREQTKEKAVIHE